jgi:glucose-6-phosphate-specific signal transduction histidine kinase
MLSMAPARRARALYTLTAVTLLCGYADLVRGGITVAPLLLVTGYVVLVPLVLLFA